MKKALLIGLVLGLVAAWAVPAMAVDLTAAGFIGVRGHIFRNTQGGPPVWAAAVPGGNLPSALNNQNGAYINSRAHLQFTLRASEDLFGVFLFRMDTGRFGAGGGGYGVPGGSVVAVGVQNVYIDFRVPPKLPLWFRVGMQPNFVRGWVFMCVDAAGVSARLMIDPIKLSITGAYMKVADPSATASFDNGELYYVDAAIPLGFGSVNIRPGMYFAYQDVRYSANLTMDDRSLWWIGAYADGTFGPVGLQFDFSYSGGTIDGAVFNPDRNVSSWLIKGVLTYTWNKLQVGAGGLYIQGEDPDPDIAQFQLPGGDYGSECRPVNGDFIVFVSGWNGTGGWPGMGIIDVPATEWPGFWDVRFFASYQIMSWLQVAAQLGYIGDTSNGATPGNPLGVDAIGSDADNDSSIGWEMDFGVNIQIYKNLSLNSAFGYLFAQKALSLAGGIAPQDPWALVSRLMYTF